MTAFSGVEGKDRLRRRRIFLELLEVAVFDLVHHGTAAEKIFLQLRGKLTRDFGELVAGHF